MHHPSVYVFMEDRVDPCPSDTTPLRRRTYECSLFLELFELEKQNKESVKNHHKTTFVDVVVENVIHSTLMLIELESPPQETS